jgi:hypothetical protein
LRADLLLKLLVVSCWYAERRDTEQAALVKSNKRKRDLFEAKLHAE